MTKADGSMIGAVLARALELVVWDSSAVNSLWLAARARPTHIGLLVPLQARLLAVFPLVSGCAVEPAANEGAAVR